MLKKIISAHEHLGVGKLSFSNGTHADYNGSVERLCEDLQPVRESFESVGCILYPNMPYKQYSSEEEYSISSHQINEEFFCAIKELPSWLTPYPFLYLRLSDPPSVNEMLLKKYKGQYYGIKIHPNAELLGVQELLDSGILDLAEENNIPITAHCSRPGAPFDFKDIKDNLFPALSSRNVRFNIAHLGFFSVEIFKTSLPERVFMDCSPIGIIYDQYRLSGGKLEDFVKICMDYFAVNAGAIMYGEDFPYNRQIWEDGSVHGKGREEDLQLLNEIMSELTESQKEQIFCLNVQRFLGN